MKLNVTKVHLQEMDARILYDSLYFLICINNSTTNNNNKKKYGWFFPVSAVLFPKQVTCLPKFPTCLWQQLAVQHSLAARLGTQR